eukprot:s6635_g7.t1
MFDSGARHVSSAPLADSGCYFTLPQGASGERTGGLGLGSGAKADAAEALPVPSEEYAQKFPKSVVIGKSNAANPKGAQVLAREAWPFDLHERGKESPSHFRPFPCSRLLLLL